MMRRSSMLVATVVIGAIAPCLTTVCRAECWGGSYGFGPYGFVNGSLASNPYAMGRIPTPPYFALHPPVYYSYPVARPYGFSPFPYPGWVPTPAISEEVVEPLIIENPHIDGTSSSAPQSKVEADDGLAASGSSPFGPQQILNPFVQLKSPKPELVTTQR